MNTQFTNQPKPTFVNVIAWMTLASGVVNLFWGLGLSLTGLLSIIGIICIPFMLLPTILGVFEIIYAAKLMSNPPQVVQPNTTLAILEIVSALVGNFFSVVVGILALVFYNDATVRNYFAGLDDTLPATAIVPVAPVPPESPAPIVNPDTVIDEIPPVDEPPFPGEETPRS